MIDVMQRLILLFFGVKMLSTKNQKIKLKPINKSDCISFRIEPKGFVKFSLKYTLNYSKMLFIKSF
jgi:hypothetical protein